MSEDVTLATTKTILFDTLSWLDFVLGNRDVFDENTTKTIENLSKGGNCLLSVVSLWEITKLVHQEVFTTTIPYHQWLEQAIQQSNTQLVQLELPIIVEAGSLPGEADDLSDYEKLLAATARTRESLLITKQDNLIDYAQQQYLNILALENDL